MVTFQRARSAEQREVRRRAILDAAAAMLAEMPVADVSLNELSRRAGLAKSNVLRYFDSREGVLLELLERAAREWLAEISAGVFDPDAPVESRREALAALFAVSLATRPVLCDLLSAQATVLERNVSPEVAARFKRSLIALGGPIRDVVRRALPELDDDRADRFVAAAMIVAGGVWSYGQPSAAMLAAYEADPELAALRIEVEPMLRDIFGTLLAGVLAR